MGLVSMRERVRMVGGPFTLVSEPGRGTIACAQVPASTEAA
jgi:signal transduction histidine kinase